MTLIGKSGEVNSPYHQYKVCTDSLTLMVVFQRDNVFSMSNNDRGDGRSVRPVQGFTK